MLRRPALFAILLLLASGMFGAHAEQRCTGTLCDFYYGGPPTDPDKPAPQVPATTNIQIPPGATLITVPRGLVPRSANGSGAPAPADTTPSRFNVEGGGLIGMMNGNAPERCSGTLCDFYYGGPPPEKSAARPAGATAAAAAEPVVDQDAAPAPMEERETVHRAPPSCVAKGRDLWSCYR